MKLLDLFLPEETDFFKKGDAIVSELSDLDLDLDLILHGRFSSISNLMFPRNIQLTQSQRRMSPNNVRAADNDPNRDIDSHEKIKKNVQEDIKNVPEDIKQGLITEKMPPIPDPIREKADALFTIFCHIINEFPDNNELSIKQWVFFHAMLEILLKQADPASDKYTGEQFSYADLLSDALTDKIEKWYNDKNNSTSPFWYAERAYWEEPSDTSDWKNLQNPDLKYSLKVIHRITSAIKDILRNQDTDIKAVYYTSLKSLKYIFDKKDDNNKDGFHPQIMSVSVMNDPAEGYLLQEYLSEGSASSHQYWWNTLPSGMEKSRYFCIEPYVFCKSFTSQDRLDDLSMWEMYGDHAKGCCCKVTIQNEQQKPLYQIAYLDKEKRAVQLGGSREDKKKLELINILLPQLKEKIAVVSSYKKEYRWICNFCRKEIMGIAYLFKDDAYSHENEIRYLASYIDCNDEEKKDNITLIPVSDGDSDLGLLSVKSDVAFVYEEVILGPKVKKPESAASYVIHQFICSSGREDSPFITKSSIQYR